MTKHTHKYVRIKIGKFKRIHFKCAIPGCVHNLKPELVVGRFSICNICGDEFTMTTESMRLAKPHCITCKKTTGSDVSKILEIMGANKS